MSRAFRSAFLREQIAAYDQLLCDLRFRETSRAPPHIIKNLEKQKPARGGGSRTCWPRRRKTDGLVFDELGIDHMFMTRRIP